MKKSNYCTVMKRNKKEVKYQRKIGITQEYYRSTPEINALDILNKFGRKIEYYFGKYRIIN